MEFAPLKGLDSSSGSVPVQVRICRLWESRNTKSKQKHLISVDMIIVDSEGTPMWLQVRSHFVPKFRSLLTARSVYIIKNFSVSVVTGQYRPVDTRFKMTFSLVTVLKLVVASTPSIPMHVFQFIPPYDVLSRSVDCTFLGDVAALLLSVGDVETVSGGYTKCDLDIRSDMSSRVKVTLWGTLAKDFVQDYNIGDSSVPLILIFTSVRVKQYMDCVNFQSTPATQDFVNLENEYVRKLSQKFGKTAPQVTFKNRSPEINGTTEEAMFENRRTIGEILDAGWVGEEEGYKMTFVGSIDEVDTRYGWYYFGCEVCKKKVFPEASIYTCGKCKKTFDSPVILYKVNFIAKDATGVLACTAMNSVAERMVDSCAMKLFNRLDVDSDAFPRQVLELSGQKYVFKISLGVYNLTRGSAQFTVSDVFTIDPVLEDRHRKSGYQKVNCSTSTKTSFVHEDKVEGSDTGDVAAAKMVENEGIVSSNTRTEVPLTPSKRKADSSTSDEDNNQDDTSGSE